MKNGQLVGTVDVAEVTDDDLLGMIVLGERPAEATASQDPLDDGNDRLERDMHDDERNEARTEAVGAVVAMRDRLRGRVPPQPQGALMFPVLVALALVVSSAAAQEIEENEALVMRLIFEDCLGFIEEDRTPFASLETFPTTDTSIVRGGPSRPDLEPYATVVHLLSERSVAVWGAHPAWRFCRIHTVWESDAPMRLGVRPEGFVERLTARAAAVGMTEAPTGDEFSPLIANQWLEPGEGEGRLSLSVMPSGEGAGGALLDAGLIHMGAGPRLGMAAIPEGDRAEGSLVDANHIANGSRLRWRRSAGGSSTHPDPGPSQNGLSGK